MLCTCSSRPRSPGVARILALATTLLLAPTTLLAIAVDAGQELSIPVQPGGVDAPDGRLVFQSSLAGNLDFTVLPGAPVSTGQTVSGGFKLLDLSFDVDFLPASPGDALQTRIGLRWSELRARARAFSLRADSLRLMRLDATAGRWSPATAGLRADGRFIRYLGGDKPEFTLGYHGHTTDNLVWAVTDLPGGRFSIAGLPGSLPEAASIALTLSGLGLLMVLGMRREPIAAA